MRAYRAVRSTALVTLLVLAALLALGGRSGEGPATGGPADDPVAGRKWAAS